MISILLAASLIFTAEDADVAWETARTLVDECTPRDAGTVRGKIAAYKVLDMVSATGADAELDVFDAQTPRGKKRFHNVYSFLKFDPTNDEYVVIISHFDTKSGVAGPGANDGGSTTGLLTGLANAVMRDRSIDGNLMLVWTDGEECMDYYGQNDGFWGSKRAVQEIKRRGIKVKAAICVDMLGDKDLKITIPKNSSRALAKIACYAAKKAGDEKLVSTIDDLVKDDHVAFLEAGIKSICLIDFEYGGAPGSGYWHTPEDTMDKLSKQSLLRSGRLLTGMLDVLFTKRSQSSSNGEQNKQNKNN